MEGREREKGRQCSDGETASTAAAKRVPERRAPGEVGGWPRERGSWPERKVEELLFGYKESGCGGCYGVGKKGETGKMGSPEGGKADGARKLGGKL
uniref:DUF834 domain-containing protein n=1 Tax=Oryza glumipatula TaxID=40148 RepID=A0A0E0AHY5_9ORYZ